MAALSLFIIDVMMIEVRSFDRVYSNVVTSVYCSERTGVSIVAELLRERTYKYCSMLAWWSIPRRLCVLLV